MLCSVVAAALSWGDPAEASSPSLASASDLIDAVNQFRASNGLGPLTVDPILMLVAENQNNYSLSIGQITHYGPDGSRPREQAIAAGYGGGATVFTSENIAMGTGLPPAGAVEMWTGDDAHLNTMIGANYRDVGAGVGERDGQFYYTLLTGYVAGGMSARSTVPAPGSSGSQIAFQPLLTSTPLPDGSVLHIVQQGQTLWTIAAVYGVDLAELLSLNGMTQDSLVHPGDSVIVRAGPTATPTASPSPTASATAEPATATPGGGEPAAASASSGARFNPRDLQAGVCVAAWIIVVVAGVVIASRRQ